MEHLNWYKDAPVETALFASFDVFYDISVICYPCFVLHRWVLSDEPNFITDLIVQT